MYVRDKPTSLPATKLEGISITADDNNTVQRQVLRRRKKNENNEYLNNYLRTVLPFVILQVGGFLNKKYFFFCVGLISQLAFHYQQFIAN